MNSFNFNSSRRFGDLRTTESWMEIGLAVAVAAFSVAIWLADGSGPGIQFEGATLDQYDRTVELMGLKPGGPGGSGADVTPVDGELHVQGLDAAAVGVAAVDACGCASDGRTCAVLTSIDQRQREAAASPVRPSRRTSRPRPCARASPSRRS